MRAMRGHGAGRWSNGGGARSQPGSGGDTTLARLIGQDSRGVNAAEGRERRNSRNAGWGIGRLPRCGAARGTRGAGARAVWMSVWHRSTFCRSWIVGFPHTNPPVSPPSKHPTLRIWGVSRTGWRVGMAAGVVSDLGRRRYAGFKDSSNQWLGGAACAPTVVGVVSSSILDSATSWEVQRWGLRTGGVGSTWQAWRGIVRSRMRDAGQIPTPGMAGGLTVDTTGYPHNAVAAAGTMVIEMGVVLPCEGVVDPILQDSAATLASCFRGGPWSVSALMPLLASRTCALAAAGARWFGSERS